jgi:hypothetical protein
VPFWLSAGYGRMVQLLKSPVNILGHSFSVFGEQKMTLTDCSTVLLEVAKKQGQTGFFSR